MQYQGFRPRLRPFLWVIVYLGKGFWYCSVRKELEGMTRFKSRSHSHPVKVTNETVGRSPERNV